MQYNMESDESNKILTQRTIEVTSTAVIVNNRITIPATLQLRPTTGSTNLNVAQTYRNVFAAMEISNAS